ncbi:DUF5753 domain-containing protein, partial [Sphaerisporangium rufum]|uniref:DUF5753 domain-containing protein n=1 Tax=Sphaerisporangium rufum TaxID=1381558 RepID=UPI001951B3FC
IRFSRSLLGFVERGQRTPNPDFVKRCDEALSAGGELIRHWSDLRGEAGPHWFKGWLGVEKEAHTLHAWEPIVVPGLLQTEDYARAVIRGEPGITREQIARAVAARMERQKILSRPDSPTFRVILDEAVLYRLVGTEEIMRMQLKRLLEALDSPRIGIQIVPMSAGVTTGVLGGFAIAQLSGHLDTVYIQTAIRGHVSNRPEDVKAIHDRYDKLRAEAQPQLASIELIREAEKRWV